MTEKRPQQRDEGKGSRRDTERGAPDRGPGDGAHGRQAPDHGAHEGLYVVGQHIPPPSEVNDTIVMGAAIVAGLSAVVFAVGLLAGAGTGVYGSALAVGLLAMAIAVRRYFAAAYPDIEGLEPRELPDADPDDDEPVTEVPPVARRSLLQRMLVGAATLLGLGLAAPVASLGPSPGDALRRTHWTSGRRLVTTDGRPLRPDDVATGGISTVWPEDAIEVENSAVILVRLSQSPPQPPTNLDWVVDDSLVAYSKVCTHAGCPVGLFRERDDALFCPCHQSTFDAARGAVPTFGPTARALPQLPMGVDDDGFLVALGDFAEQVGPAFG
ncbi:MAG TPA: Rieske (2Fe-2S) protein [Egibacteraceae bacterium]|nr:Rieske (2Fe-2S) protein [Egibacteraceae bacterium]